MPPRYFRWAAILLFAAACAGSPNSSIANSETTSTPPPAPNIIIILTDDLGWGDIALNGSRLIKTPNIDRIGQEGIQLTDFYAGSNVCSPSRAALLTGRYPIRSGMQHVIFPHSQDGLPADETTIAEMLRDTGYRTGMIGKWHLGHTDEFWPTNQGFDWFYGVAYSNDMAPFDLYEGKTIIQSPADQSQLSLNYAKAAKAFIEEGNGKPFFLYYAETFPHIPLFVSDDRTGKSEAGLYGDVVETLDAGIGIILDALDEAGVADNTLIVFTSDNGPWFEGSAGDLRGRKGETHEGGFRVPFLARWPGRIPAGSVSHEMAMNIDLLPTAAAISGAHLPDDRVIDGRDLTEMLTSGASTPHDLLFFFDGNDIVAARDKRFRLVLNTFYRTMNVPFEYFGAALLFDLEKDPEESFSFLREYPAEAERLKSAVQALRKEVAGNVKEATSHLPPTDGTPTGPQLND
ncbi:sulfatase [Hyphomonas sp. WL0036]|uniref:sulfatase family protein n=1 Tax=Hyphomonas sediminis TaxID=2866160 RepID=UPI001C811E51|nr:sulfatase [Hyphomonas sediminis]MBY9068203.1 sulfatase [Hyphomonas sediminis]